MIGAGFIGSEVVRRAAGAGLSVGVLTRRPVAQSLAAHVTIADARDRAAVEEMASSAAHIVLCGSGALPAASVADPAEDAAATLDPLLSVLEVARHHPGLGVTLLSSGGTVYGAPRTEPVAEDHPLEPIVPYGISKMAAERYVAFYGRTHGVPGRILRLGNVYGPTQPARRGQGVVAALLDAARTGAPVPLYGDGSVARDYVHVDDVTDAIVRLGPPGSGTEVFNVGTGVATPLVDVIRVVEEVTGSALPLQHHPGRAYDVERIALDSSRLDGRIGFRPRPLRAGVQQAWAALMLGDRRPVPAAR